MILTHKLLKAKAHQIANSSAFLLTVKWQQTQNHDNHMCTNEEGLSSHRLGGGGGIQTTIQLSHYTQSTTPGAQLTPP